LQISQSGPVVKYEQAKRIENYVNIFDNSFIGKKNSTFVFLRVLI
jgi:hypothetical protein